MGVDLCKTVIKTLCMRKGCSRPPVRCQATMEPFEKGVKDFFLDVSDRQDQVHIQDSEIRVYMLWPILAVRISVWGQFLVCEVPCRTVEAAGCGV